MVIFHSYVTHHQRVMFFVGTTCYNHLTTKTTVALEVHWVAWRKLGWYVHEAYFRNWQKGFLGSNLQSYHVISTKWPEKIQQQMDCQQHLDIISAFSPSEGQVGPCISDSNDGSCLIGFQHTTASISRECLKWGAIHWDILIKRQHTIVHISTW